MSTALSQPSFEELYKALQELPDDQRGEILAGELVVSPRPASDHGVASTAIIGLLWPRFRGGGGGGNPGGWLILHEPELHLHVGGRTDVLSPDVAGWQHTTLPKFRRTRHVEQTPDWVCEVLSPSTIRRDQKTKSRIYHDAGVRWLWLVDPVSRRLFAYRREGAFWVWLGEWGGTDLARVEPFESVELDLALWWDDMAPEEP